MATNDEAGALAAAFGESPRRLRRPRRPLLPVDSSTEAAVLAAIDDAADDALAVEMI